MRMRVAAGYMRVAHFSLLYLSGLFWGLTWVGSVGSSAGCCGGPPHLASLVGRSMQVSGSYVDDGGNDLAREKNLP
jgi:hypothetical protein